MARFMFLNSFGSSDPTRAVLPLVKAKGAVEAGHDVEVVFEGDAVVLMQDIVAENTKAVGWPTAKEVLDFLVDRGVPVFV